MRVQFVNVTNWAKLAFFLDNNLAQLVTFNLARLVTFKNGHFFPFVCLWKCGVSSLSAIHHAVTKKKYKQHPQERHPKKTASCKSTRPQTTGTSDFFQVFACISGIKGDLWPTQNNLLERKPFFVNFQKQKAHLRKFVFCPSTTPSNETWVHLVYNKNPSFPGHLTSSTPKRDKNTQAQATHPPKARRPKKSGQKSSDRSHVQRAQICAPRRAHNLTTKSSETAISVLRKRGGQIGNSSRGHVKAP